MWINSPAYTRNQRKLAFSKHGEYYNDRLLAGFYYYLHPEEVGDRSKGWLMMAHDSWPELTTCAGCGAQLIAPNGGKPYWCIECSQEMDKR